jgi:hypothetical protein
MRLAMVVSALLFNLVVTGVFEAGLFDVEASPENGAVHSCQDMPPPPSWP